MAGVCDRGQRDDLRAEEEEDEQDERAKKMEAGGKKEERKELIKKRHTGREICVQPAAAAVGTQEEGRGGGEKVAKLQLCLQAVGQALGCNPHLTCHQTEGVHKGGTSEKCEHEIVKIRGCGKVKKDAEK